MKRQCQVSSFPLSLLLLSLITLSPLCSFGLQFGNSSGRDVGNLRVRVTDTNDRPLGIQAHVQLIGTGSASVVDEGYCNNEGMIAFSSVPVGSYHLIVSGDGLEQTDSGFFEVDERKTTQMEFVRVKRTANADDDALGAGNKIAVRDLNIPESASKEFDQATKALNHQDWKKAVTYLNRAVAIYPKYVEAYTNLGAAYEHLRDAVHEREALTKAIGLDANFAPALMNLGMLSMIERKYAESEDELSRASAADATNPQILMLLAQAQLLNRHFDQAIASTEKLHALPHHEKYAKAHYIAARAFEHENRANDAANQLEEFLSEQPNGPMADAVRKELANLGGQASASPPSVGH
jgi:Flp pilus assembly protein TadD